MTSLQLTAKQKSYSWLVWSLAAIFFFYKFIIEVSPSVMSAEMMQYFSIDATEMGNLAASYFYAYLIMQIPMGILLDRFGPRKVISIAIVLCSLGTLIFSHSTLFFTAGLGRFITGIGAAVAAIGCLKLTTLWFPPKRFALMAGLMMTVGMLGAVVGEAPLSIAIAHFGWRPSLVNLAYVGFAMAILFVLFVRDAGYYADFTHATPSPSKFWHSVLDVLKRKQTWLLSLYSGLAFAPVSVFGGLWGVPYLQAVHGYSKTMAAEAVSLVFVGFAIGCPLMGWLSDFIGKRKPTMVYGTLLATLMLFLVLYLPNISVLSSSILLFLFGFFISSFLLSFSMVREVNQLAFAATALGFMNSFDAALGAVSDPFIGHILDLGWRGKMLNGVRIFPLESYHIAMGILLLYIVFAALLLPFLRETYCRQQN